MQRTALLSLSIAAIAATPAVSRAAITPVSSTAEANAYTVVASHPSHPPVTSIDNGFDGPTGVRDAGAHDQDALQPNNSMFSYLTTSANGTVAHNGMSGSGTIGIDWSSPTALGQFDPLNNGSVDALARYSYTFTTSTPIVLTVDVDSHYTAMSSNTNPMGMGYAVSFNGVVNPIPFYVTSHFTYPVGPGTYTLEIAQHPVATFAPMFPDDRHSTTSFTFAIPEPACLSALAPLAFVARRNRRDAR